MFFQFSPPQRKPVEEVVPPPPVEEVEVLSLAPFTRNPKIAFENVTVGTKAKRNLVITNPLNHDVQITIRPDFADEIGVELSWYQHIIEKNQDCKVEITWTPTTEGSWRHMLHISDGKKIQRDIPVAFKSTSPKKNKSKGKSKGLPKFKTIKSPIHNGIKRKSPMKSPKKRSALPNITNTPSIYVNDVPEHKIVKSKGKENYNCQFSPAPVINFNFESDLPSRRETYVVPKVPLKTSPLRPSDNSSSFVDSLEMDSSPLKCDISKDFTAEFNPFETPARNFKPECFSTEEKSQNGTSYFENHFKSVEKNSTFEIMREVEMKANISTETYVKSNLSTETYVKDNLSTETYVKGNTSTETYVKEVNSDTFNLGDIQSSPYIKENSLTDLANFQFSPLVPKSSKIEPKPKLLADVFFETGLRNYENYPLSCIKEESWCSDSSSFSTKRKSNCTFEMTPTKRINLGVSDWSKRGGSAFGILKKSTGLRTKVKEGGKMVTVTNTKDVTVRDPFLLAAISENGDPFTATTIQYDEEWMDKQQANFKKWLNSLLDPTGFNSNEENHVDIQKIWEQCKKKEEVIAPSKELLSNRYHTNFKLNALRKSAKALFRTEEISSVLSKVASAIDNDKLTVRQDRDIHLDLFLQKEIMTIILSYNSLWLRIGFETIYNEIIPMNSNSDVVALSTFILERLLKDPRLLKKHKTVHSPRYCKDIKKFILKKFLTLVYFLDQAKTKKLIQHDPCLFRKNGHYKESREILLKFAREALLAVGDVTKYLKHFGYVVHHKQTYIDEFNYAVKSLGLDLRDGVRLTKVAEIILLRNDLTKNLRVPAISLLQKIHNVKIVFDSLLAAGFEICNDITPKDIVEGHKEKTLSFLWQIIYKFQAPLMIKCATTIQTWWRSGPVMVKRDKLRKIYEEKTQATKKIQQWYRRRLFLRKLQQFLHLVELYIEHKRRYRAAALIQSYFRMYINRKKFLRLRKIAIGLQKQGRRWLASEIRARNLAATKIQSYVRMFIARQSFLKLKYCVLFAEQKYVAIKQMKRQKEYYDNLKYMVICIQNRFRANRLCKERRREFLRLKAAVIFVQRRYRAIAVGKKVRAEFISLKYASIIIQEKYKAKIMGRNEREKFLSLKAAAIIVQRLYRAKILGRMERQKFLQLKNCVSVIGERYLAQKYMKRQKEHYDNLKYMTICMQNRFRANRLCKEQRMEFLRLKTSAIFVQRRFRAIISGRKVRAEFIALKCAAIVLQERYKAKIMGRTERQRFLSLKKATITVQRLYRAKILGRLQRITFLQLKCCVRLLEETYLAKKQMRLQKDRYENLRKAIISTQNRFRANKLCKEQRQKFLRLKITTIFVQRRYRAIVSGRKIRTEFLVIKSACVVIQRRYRALIQKRIERQRFLTLKNAAIAIQRRFRARILGRLERNKFLQLKYSVLLTEERYVAKKQMILHKGRYEKLKSMTIRIQHIFRANKWCKKQRKEFLELKSATICVQRRYRGIIMGRKVRAEFDSLRYATVVIQERYRALISRRIERRRFLRLKQATITVQRLYRARILGRSERTQFIQLKQATTTIQQHYRAYRVMIQKRQEFLTLRRASDTIQRRLRATLLMKKHQSEYEKIRNATIVIQRRFRATVEMRKQLINYRRLKNAAITLQRRYRAKIKMRQQFTLYQKIKKASLVIQRRYRAIVEMRKQATIYNNMKNAAIVIQRRFRASVEMKKQLIYYQSLKKAAAVIQMHYRATIKMRQQFNLYQKMKKASIVMQRRYRANVEMRKQLVLYHSLKNAAIVIQRRYRATIKMRQQRILYQRMKKAAIVIQRHYSATHEMRKQRILYQQLKKAAVMVQRRFRAIGQMRKQLTLYRNLKKATIVIQRRYRATVEMRRQFILYQRTKMATIVIQKHYRATIEMRKQFIAYQNMKNAAIVIQRRFRAIREMRKQFMLYQNLKKSVIVIQRRYRATLAMRKQFILYQSMKKSAILIQTHGRRFLMMRKYGEYLKPEVIRERRRQRRAATRIQAAWKGYKTRSTDEPEIVEIRKKLEEATENALPENTLGSRCTQALELLNRKASVLEIIMALEDIGFVIRRCKITCLKMSPVLSESLYITITSTNRSPPEMKACTAATNILIDFYKYPPSRQHSFILEHIEKLITVMLHWCDKESPLFPSLCTLVWLFCHTEEYKKTILSSPNFWQKINKMDALCHRKEKMVSKVNTTLQSVFFPFKNLPLPSVKPDWGIEQPSKPKVFCNSLHAFNSLLSILKQ